jgi:hypothetical protein
MYCPALGQWGERKIRRDRGGESQGLVRGESGNMDGHFEVVMGGKHGRNMAPAVGNACCR